MDMEIIIPAHILNANVDSMLARGRWLLDRVDMAPEGGMVRTVTGHGTFETKAGGTCSVCGLAIRHVARFEREDKKERATLGLDCAKRLAQRQAEARGKSKSAAVARIEKEEKIHQRVLRAARKDRKIASGAAAAEQKHAAVLARLDTLAATTGAPSFAHSFAQDLARRIRQGHASALSERQADLLARLERESHTTVAA